MHLDNAAGARILDPGRKANAGRIGAVKHEIVVIAAAALQLLVGRPDAGADGHRLAEVEWRAGHIGHHARGYQGGVDRGERVGCQCQLVPQHIANAGTGQVEVGMVGQVDMGRPVGGGAVVDPQRILVGQRIGDREIQVARIAFLTVGAR